MAVLIFKPLLAVVAAVGFSMVFKVKKEHLLIVGSLAFCGYLVKNILMVSGVGIELSVLAGALCVGILCDIFEYKSGHRLQMLKVPAGIPMIPGAFVFEAIKNLIAFVSSASPDTERLLNVFYYGGKSVFIIAALAFGLTATSVIFKRG